MSAGKSARYNRFSAGPANLPTPDTATEVRGHPQGRVCLNAHPAYPSPEELPEQSLPLVALACMGNAVGTAGVSESVRAHGLGSRRACWHMSVCVHVLSGVKVKSRLFSLQTRMETTFGPAFSAVTTITKGEPRQGWAGESGPAPHSQLLPRAPPTPAPATRPPLHHLARPFLAE